MNKKPINKKEVIRIFKSVRVSNKKIEIINLSNSINLILAEDIKSLINVPTFNNSAVDGYAIKNSDISLKIKFKIIEKILAGDNKEIVLKSGEAVRIFTGAKMPKNSKTVIMQENAIEKNGMVTFLKNPKKNQNCRLLGEDILKNKIVLKAGDVIKSNNQSILASIGRNKIKVFKKLSVGFFTSGNELKNPGKNLSGSKINNSNKYAISSLIKEIGFNVKNLGVLRDNEIEINKLIMRNIKNFDVIITTGGASVGDEDHLIKTIKKIGILKFWKIAIKPGRPLGFGFIKNKAIICLPGNPVSVFLLFAMLVRPFLYKLAGSNWKEPKSIPGIVKFNMKKKTKRMEWLRVIIDKAKSDKLLLKKYDRQGSGIISSIAFSDGIIEIPENCSYLNAGDVFKFYPNEYLF